MLLRDIAGSGNKIPMWLLAALLLLTLLQPPVLLTEAKYLNQVEYQALKDLYDATNGSHWRWLDKWLYNGKPWDFSDPEIANPCAQHWQGLLCSLAYCEENGTNCNVFALDLTGFNLQGTLPLSIVNLVNLTTFSVGDNQLQGSLPSLSSLPTLTSLNLSHNLFHGRIHDDLINPNQSMSLLYLSGNQLTGPIPDYIYLIPDIQFLNLYNNQLTGTLSPLIDVMNCTSYINFAMNNLKGSIPEEINNLHYLRFLYLYSNYMTGKLPFTATRSLRELWISNNSFSGSIPPELCMNKDLSMFAAFNNKLEGTIPSCFGSLSDLRILQLQQNQLYGNNLPEVFNPSVQKHLAYIDLSDNSFSGSFPSNIFLLPSLVSIAAVKNCFAGSLPSSICTSGKFLQVIALDGMRSSSDCLNYIWDPLHVSVGYFSSNMEGTIPDCVWMLPNITVLHLSGNGFEGTLPYIADQHHSKNPEKCTIRDLSLSHNRLIGTIPDGIQQISFNRLDLSYNKLYGTVTQIIYLPFSYQSNHTGASINLKENRLTGKLPSEWHDAYHMDVLNGNLFDCHSTHEDLPQHDPIANTYICGSDEYDGAFLGLSFFIAIAASALVFIALILYCARRNAAFVKKSLLAVKYTLDYCQHIYGFDNYIFHHHVQVHRESMCMLDTPDGLIPRESEHSQPSSSSSQNSSNMMLSEGEVSYMKDRASHASNHTLYNEEENDRMIRYRNVFQFLSSLTLIRRICIFIAWYAVFICLPAYLLFYEADSTNKTKYSTHESRYSWVMTSIFLTGYFPASILLVMWTLLIFFLLLSFIVHFNLHTLGNTKLTNMMQYLKQKKSSFAMHLRNRASSVSWRFSFLQSPTKAAGNYQTVSTEEAEEAPENDRSKLLGKSLVAAFEDSDDGNNKSPTPSTKADGGSSRKSMLTIDNWKELIQDEDWKEQLQSNFMYTFVFLINTTICILVNVSYLFIQNASTISSDAKIIMQVMMAGFKIFWNIVAIRIMISWLPRSTITVKLHVFLLVFNSIVAPCLATAFTDQACFRDFFTGSETVCTSYSINTCLESYQKYDGFQYETVCTNYANIEYVTEINPSFIYYYTCGSKLLTAYIPVYIYIYSILLITSPFLYATFASIATRRLPAMILKRIDAIVRPHDRNKVPFERLIRAISIQALLTQHIVVLLTFGICSPLLAVVIAGAISMDCLMWQFFVTRYIKYENPHSPFSNNFPLEAVSVAPSCCEGVCSSVGACCEITATDTDELANDPLLPGRNTTSKKAAKRGALEQLVAISLQNNANKNKSIFQAERNFHVDQYHKEDRALVILSEESRLNELNTVIGEAWLCVRNAMWLVFYCSMMFYAFIIFDMVGDMGGWEMALYLVIVVVLLIILIRLFLMDTVIFVNNRFFSSEADTVHEGRFSSFYYHQTKTVSAPIGERKSENFARHPGNTTADKESNIVSGLTEEEGKLQSRTTSTAKFNQIDLSVNSAHSNQSSHSNGSDGRL